MLRLVSAALGLARASSCASLSACAERELSPDEGYYEVLDEEDNSITATAILILSMTCSSTPQTGPIRSNLWLEIPHTHASCLWLSCPKSIQAEPVWLTGWDLWSSRRRRRRWHPSGPGQIEAYSHLLHS